MYLLDTNVISEIRKAGDGRADAQVTAWYASVDADDAYISVVTVMEIEFGVIKVEQRDAAQALRLRHWLHHHIIPVFDGRVLPIGNATALRCAPLHYPQPRSWRDSWIAATALEHDLTVATRNVRDFVGTGVAVVDPWEATP